MKRRKFIRTGIGAAAGFSGFLLPDKSLRTGLFPIPVSGTANTIVKVLGTAQDGGLPQMGCSCDNCRRARRDQRFARLIASLVVWDSSEKKYFLIDATPDIRSQLEMLPFREPPDAVLLTHAHIGHYTGLMFFGYEAMSTEHLPVFCSERMADFLRTNGPWSQLVSKNNIALDKISTLSSISLTRNLTITPYLVPHRDEYSDTLGFFIRGENKALLYIPDIQKWSAWDLSIEEEAEKADYALLDGTFFSQEELPGRDLEKIGHPLIRDSIRILGRLVRKGRTKVYFTHFNHSNPVLNPSGKAAALVKDAGFFLADDGMELPL